MRIDITARLARLGVVVFILFQAIPAAAQDFTALPLRDNTDPTPGDGICGPAADDSRCTLRAAVQEANALGGTHVITVRAGRHSIGGPAGDDSAFGGLDVHGPAVLILRGEGVSEARCAAGGCFGGARETLIDARGIDRAFHLHRGGVLRLENLAIINGGERHGHDDDIFSTAGGAILNDGGDLTLDNVAIADNRATEGGGLLNRGNATIRFSLFTRNGATTLGGAISSTGTLTVLQSVFHGNGAGDEGGGLAIHGGGSLAGALRHVVLTNNGTHGSGGGLWLQGLTNVVMLDEAFVAGNHADRGGGGVFNNGRLTIDRTTVERNIGTGIRNDGAISIIRTNILRNRGAGGGGVSNRAALTIEASTIADNTSEFDGGGLFDARPDGRTAPVLTNVTISGNRAERNGGGIFNVSAPFPLTLRFVTITGNLAAFGGGIFGHAATYDANGTVIAGNLGSDCFRSDAFVVRSPTGVNMDGDASCRFRRAIGDPGFGPLADNGGRTLTRAVPDGSPLIDAVAMDFCVDGAGAPLRVDQRGTRRPAGAGCDIGAFEVTRPLPPWATLPPGVFFDIEIAVGRLTLLSIDLLKVVAGDSEAEPMAMKMATEADAMSAAFDAFMKSPDAFAGAQAIAELSARLGAFTTILKAFESCCAKLAPNETAALLETQAELVAALADAQVPLLIARVKALPIADGIKNSLVKQLETRAFGAFVQHVEAQRGKKIDAATADALLAAVKEQ